MNNVLRTPEERFEGLHDFAFAPHYLDVENADGEKLRMHYLDEGTDAHGTLVLFHGQGSWGYIYRHMIPPLVDAGIRVLVPDFIGFGRSDKPVDGKRHTHSAHVDWLGQFIDQVAPPHVAAFCFDWGGHFAMRMAVEQPGRFGKLAYSNAQPPLANPQGAKWFLAWRADKFAQPEFPISGMVAEGVKREFLELERAGFDAPFPDEAHKAGPKQFPWMHPVILEGPEAEAYQQAWTAMAKWQKPFLMLSCEGEARNAEVMQKHIPGAAGQPHQSLTGCSFFLQEDKSPELASALIEFVRS